MVPYKSVYYYYYFYTPGSKDPRGYIIITYIIIIIQMRQEMMGFWDAFASAGQYANNLHLVPDR